MNKVTRTFQISGFGIVNCDNPGGYPSEVFVSASFKTTDRNIVKFNTVYLVQKDKNTIFTYNGDDNYRSGKTISNLGFEPSADNIIWAAIDSKHFGIVRRERLKGQFTNGEKKTFEMDVIEVNDKTVSEMKKLFDI